MSEVIKDIARQERLNQVYRHLFAHFGISSQTEFADALHIQRTALSSAERKRGQLHFPIPK